MRCISIAPRCVLDPLCEFRQGILHPMPAPGHDRYELKSFCREMNRIFALMVFALVSTGCSNDMNDSDPEAAHEHSIYHRAEIVESGMCGCFYCTEVFEPKKITEWTDTSEDQNRHTAMCPKCGIDSVIGDKSGYPITKKFLENMRKRWF